MLLFLIVYLFMTAISTGVIMLLLLLFFYVCLSVHIGALFNLVYPVLSCADDNKFSYFYKFL